MRKLLLLTSLFATWLTCTQALAATPTDFYAGLLERGVADVEAGRFQDAVTPLRIAAFGLVDSIDAYEKSLAYLAVALHNTGQSGSAGEVLQRILAAERVQRRFASLQLPAPIRTQLDAIARTQLTAAEAAALARTAIPAAGAPRQGASPTQAPSRAATTVAQPKPAPTKPPAATQPAPAKQAPKQTPEGDAKPQQGVPRTTPQTSQSAAVEPKPAVKGPPVKPAATTPSKAAVVADTPSRLAAGDRALSTGNLTDARQIYRELLARQDLDHGTWIRVAEGLYRSRDFTGTLAAFDKIKTLRAGEEAYRYYVAVALYETGQLARARQELAAVLPYIEQTPDVLRYRKKIEDAR